MMTFNGYPKNSTEKEVIGKGHWGLSYFNWSNNAVFDCYTSTARLSDFFAVFQRAWTEMTLQKTIFNWKQLFRMNGQVNQVQILICGFKSFFLKL